MIRQETDNVHTAWAKKVRPQTHSHNSVKSWPITIFFHWKIPLKICSKSLLKISSLLAHIATLPCKNINVRKQTNH